MERKPEAGGSPSDASHEKTLSILAESPPTEKSTDSSNNLGERLMNLPIELKQMIICLLTPKERCHLRLINKTMLHIVDTSMSYVQDIHISFAVHSNIDSYVRMSTINPYNGADENHFYKRPLPSSLPFLLKWAGTHLEALALSIHEWKSEDDNSHLMHFYPVFEAINDENVCSKLEDLRVAMTWPIWDNEIILSQLLKYVTKRQLQATATDHPIPFLHSLTFENSSDSHRCPPPPVEPVNREGRRKFLQDLLDQCQGLKELDVDNLLVVKKLPTVALRYPATLTYLKGERLGRSPGDIPTIIDNCRKLQIITSNVEFLRDSAEVHALTSLSNLRNLTLESSLTEEEIVRIFPQCFATFEDHPFGASVAHPWSQLKWVTLNCYKDVNYEYSTYRLLLSGANCCITSLYLTRHHCWDNSSYTLFVQQLFEALNTKNACPNLMVLNISSCEVVSCIAFSLATPEGRQRRRLRSGHSSSTDYSELPTPFLCGILDDLLAYVTKRQSAVQLGKRFLRKLSITFSIHYCNRCDDRLRHMQDRCEELEQIRTTVQQILDQCHGLEDLYMESLRDEMINPNRKRAKELMQLVPLRFPKTLKKLNCEGLGDFPNDQ